MLMKQYVTLTMFVLIGFVSTLAVSFLSPWPGPPSESFWLLAPQSQFSFVFTSTLYLVIGGAIMGYLCGQLVKTKLAFVWITPGFYLMLYYAAISTEIAHDKSSPEQSEVMVFGALTFLVSWAGIGLGHYVRCEVLKDRQKESLLGVDSSGKEGRPRSAP